MCFLCVLDSLDKFYKKFYLLFFAFGKTGKIKLLKVNIKMYDAFIHLVHILTLIKFLGETTTALDAGIHSRLQESTGLLEKAPQNQHWTHGP